MGYLYLLNKESKMRIGEIIEMRIEMQEIPIGTKAEVVGKGVNGIFYVRLLFVNTLIELNTKDENILFKKVPGSFIQNPHDNMIGH